MSLSFAQWANELPSARRAALHLDEIETNGGPPPEADEPSQGEQDVLDLLRNLERTARAHTTAVDLFAAEETRINQAAVVRALISGYDRRGEPVPDYLRQIYEKVISGTFE